MPKDSIAEKKRKHNNFFVYINFCAELRRLANTFWRIAAIFGALRASCHIQLSKRAAAEGMSLSELVASILDQAIDDRVKLRQSL